MWAVSAIRKRVSNAEHTFVFRSLNLQQALSGSLTNYVLHIHLGSMCCAVLFLQILNSQRCTERGIKLWEYVCVCKRNWQFQQMVSCTPQCQSPHLDAHWFLRDTRLCSDTLTCLQARARRCVDLLWTNEGRKHEAQHRLTPLNLLFKHIEDYWEKPLKSCLHRKMNKICMRSQYQR